MTKVKNVYRLKGALSSSASVRVGSSASQGGFCKGRPTRDLIIQIQDTRGLWSHSEDFAQYLNQRSGPCELRATPMEEGFVELRVSYPEGYGKIQFLSFATDSSFVVDHWLQEKETPKTVKRAPADNGLRESLDELFENDLSWKRLLGMSGEATDMTSPELDKFRGFEKEVNSPKSDLALEKRALELPFLEFPMFERKIQIEDQPLKHKRYTKAGTHEKQLFAEAMNYIVFLIDQKEWAKAQRALLVLEKSKASSQLAEDDPYLWALRGQIRYELSKKLESKELLLSALESWKQGLSKTVKKGFEADSYDVYMLTELGRHLLDLRSYYALASLMTWAQKYSWPEKTIEQVQFLKAESLFQLQLYSDAQQEFERFSNDRLKLSGRLRISDYFLAASLFRVGDVNLKQRKWSEAVASYTYAIKKTPTLNKFAFEGSWYPTILKDFSEVLLNRAEASVHLGNYKDALRDLRSFMYVDGNHPHFGLALYRVSDLLMKSGVEKERVLGALSECAFKTTNSISDRLCAARKAAYEMGYAKESEVPRLLSKVEDMSRGLEKVKNAEIFAKEDLKAYSNLLASEAFIQRNEPFQALVRVEPNFKIQAAPYLLAWSEEYGVTALAGTLEGHLAKRDFEVVVKEYEDRHRDWFFQRTRFPLVIRVAEAFAEMGLSEESHKASVVAKLVKEAIGRTMARPYDVSDSRVDFLDARNNFALFKKKIVSRQALVSSLSLLGDDRADFLRLKVLAQDWLDDRVAKLESYAKLRSLDSLSWSEVYDYSRTLLMQSKEKEQENLLESYVGSWVSRSPASISQSDAPPSPDLVLELSQIRVKRGRILEALTLVESALSYSAKSPVESRYRLLYEKGKIYKTLGRDKESRETFATLQAEAPGTLWANLSLLDQ